MPTGRDLRAAQPLLGSATRRTRFQDTVPGPRGSPCPLTPPSSGPGGIERIHISWHPQDGGAGGPGQARFRRSDSAKPCPAYRTANHGLSGDWELVLQVMATSPGDEADCPPRWAGTSKAQGGMPALTEESGCDGSHAQPIPGQLAIGMQLPCAGRPVTRKSVPNSGCRVPGLLVQLPDTERGRTGCPSAGRRRGPPARRPP